MARDEPLSQAEPWGAPPMPDMAACDCGEQEAEPLVWRTPRAASGDGFGVMDLLYLLVCGVLALISLMLLAPLALLALPLFW
ncbi:hypothetical protein [Magnetofaba australis]|uniref:hypothetical protein n=1 Tax=Magnetofaba australis TaxID=1472297 RepID=UPI000A19B845|nr:hypothetical protein [Magnetofaba australis]